MTKLLPDISVAPEVVTITGHQYAKAGETVTLKCESSISNPAAVLTWFSGRDKLEGDTSETKPSEEVRVLTDIQHRAVFGQTEGTVDRVKSLTLT